ncbi:hypothetical protein LINPERHAP2_LOCUS32162, partial [Linum perenne]
PCIEKRTMELEDYFSAMDIVSESDDKPGPRRMCSPG